ncbi:hypothetical protein [Shewanella surugensis]|uniref:Uncharacterized protein n=1 Tax=Shewanella surugensis TaxID=212020 RepID=A0ABT0L5J7_9GAMM|nr:hypothetical protein [Shewanella surugensis]MCL1122962.1 hypothetical protein [Shewanella surugensis]
MDVFVVLLVGLGLISSGVIYFANKKPVLWLGAFVASGVLALTIVIGVLFKEYYWLGNIGLGVALFASVLMCRRFPNWAYLIAIPAVMKLVDVLWLNEYLLTQVPSWAFYLSYIGYDVLVMALIWYRGPIAKVLKLKVHYQRFAQEYLLLGVYGLFVLTNLMTGMENLIRHDLLGSVFVGFEPRLFYDLYRYVRLPINIAEMIVLVMISYFAVKAGMSQKQRIKGVRL